MRPIKVGPQSTAMTAVLPFAPRPSPSFDGDNDAWIYDLEPAHPLPTVDLARSLQSELFSERMIRVTRAMRRRPLMLMLAYVVTTSSYFASLVTPAEIGGYIALVGVIVGLPGIFLVLSQLRYDIMVLLAGCFDVWFSSICWLLVFLALAGMLHDLRAVIVVSYWLGSWPNTCHDAVLVTIRPIVIFNVVCVFISVFIVFSVSCNTIDRLHNFVVFQYADSVLPARAVVTEGFSTVIAIMLRTIYRRRIVFQRHRRSRDLDCVIYRSHLRLVHRDRATQKLRAQSVHTTTELASDVNPHIQTLRFVRDLDSIDARNTILPAAFSFITARRTLCGRVWPVLTCLAVVLTIASMVVMVVSDVVTAEHYALIVAANALTACNGVACLLLFHRQLLWLMCWSFDYLFLVAQLASLHVCASDLFERRRSAVLLALLSWQWLHWVLLLDALTPPVKAILRLPRRLPLFIYACAVGAAGLLVYMIVFAHARTVDHELWRGTVLGRTVVFRVLPQFYSALSVVFVMMLRYCWRQCWSASAADLVVVDGAVAFTNSLARARRGPARTARQAPAPPTAPR